MSVRSKYIILCQKNERRILNIGKNLVGMYFCENWIIRRKGALAGLNNFNTQASYLKNIQAIQKLL